MPSDSVMNVLTLDDVSFSYDGRIPVIRSVSCSIRRGEFLTLVGPNGSGKSTLLRLLDRILLPSRGTITLEGKNINEHTRTGLAKKITLVPQEGGQVFPFSVADMVLMGRSPHVRNPFFENDHDREIAQEMMRQVDIAHLAHHPVTALSGGERQRVFLARALAQQPGILLLDEPNAHLDLAHQLEVFTILRNLTRTSGLTVVSISHDLNLAAAFSDRIGMLLCGSLTVLDTPEKALTEHHINEVFGTRVIIDRHPSEPVPRVTLRSSH